jgi:hypothetical protein
MLVGDFGQKGAQKQVEERKKDNPKVAFREPCEARHHK